jgi:peroxiredoxin
MLRCVRSRHAPLAAGIGLWLAWGALACDGQVGQADGTAPAGAASTPSAQTVPSGEIAPAATRPKPAARRERKEKPLPAFSGWTLEGERISISSFIGKRLLIYFFDPSIGDAATVTQAVTRIAPLRRKHNFAILGVARRSNRNDLKEFINSQGIDFPVIADDSDSIGRRLGLRQPLAMLGIDAEGYVISGMAQFPREQNAADLIEGELRVSLRLPPAAGQSAPAPGDRPLAPVFSSPVLDSEEPFDLAAQRGRAVVLIFFLHTCPHCHDALGFLKTTLAEMPEASRPVLVGVEISGRTRSVRDELRNQELDFFPVLFDDDGSIREAYATFAGVPDTFLIDPEGRIVHRIQGWRAREDPPLLKMRLAKVSGAPVPMLLRTKGYSGSNACGVCHESEHETWLFTRHSTAFDTLVKHAEETNPECVGCHVVGYGKPGGFEGTLENADLEDVGCESCHGRGGPHLSPGFVQGGDYAPACATCHDAKHSLGFEYATFLPKVSHAALDSVRTLPPGEKQRVLAALGAPRQALLPTNAAYVGSDACASCHAAEFATWASSPHAHAIEPLSAAGQAADADCLACHTTAYGRTGGFPRAGGVADHPDLARVGCESCHGPGGNHVGEDQTKIGSIVSLADKCDSCVILQICGSCHDDANDPDFEFTVQDKIEAQRHGTIEPGTGRPLEAGGAARAAPGLEQMLGDAFAQLDGRATPAMPPPASRGAGR